MTAIRRGERHAARVVWRQLRSHVGVFGALGVLASVAGAKLRGEPFRRLGPAVDERDRLSRRQCGDLVLLDRALRARGQSDAAAAVTREAVLQGAIPFLDALLPPLDDDPTEEDMVALAETFFNAEGKGRKLAEGSFAFDVRRCRFVELLQAVEAEHLMTLFCEADEVYFDGQRRPITLRRKGTLARGAEVCDFRFSR